MAAIANQLELQGLIGHYALSLDDRDVEGFLGVFWPQARLTVVMDRRDDGVEDVTRVSYVGYEQLAEIPKNLRTYEKTFHFMGNQAFSIADEHAVGEVYGEAHHVRLGESPLDNIAYIRYTDEYDRGADGRWRISVRNVRILWTEERTGPYITSHIQR
jgi:hypothetical protein